MRHRPMMKPGGRGKWNPAMYAIADPDRKAESDALVLANLKLVHYFAHRYDDGITESQYDDLAGAGFLGLVKASRIYDPSRGRFPVYAVSIIRREISWEWGRIRSQVIVDTNTRIRVKVVERTAGERGIDFRSAYLALGYPPGQMGSHCLAREAMARSYVSADAMRSEYDGLELLGVETGDPSDGLSRAELMDLIMDALGELPFVYRDSLMGRLRGESGDTIGRRHGLSDSTIMKYSRISIQWVRYRFGLGPMPIGIPFGKAETA
jgi:RNA polymerase sigma factor (sigma-70 family)